MSGVGAGDGDEVQLAGHVGQPVVLHRATPLTVLHHDERGGLLIDNPTVHLRHIQHQRCLGVAPGHQTAVQQTQSGLLPRGDRLHAAAQGLAIARRRSSRLLLPTVSGLSAKAASITPTSGSSCSLPLSLRLWMAETKRWRSRSKESSKLPRSTSSTIGACTSRAAVKPPRLRNHASSRRKDAASSASR